MSQENGTALRYASLEERERRMAAFREGMDREGLEALVVCGRGDIRYRGRVFYASDIWQLLGDTFVVVPRRGDPVFVNETLMGVDQAMLTDWAKDFRTSTQPGKVVGEVLSDLGLGKSDIGIVGLSDALSAHHFADMRSVLPDAGLRDATLWFDEVRQVKSEEELENLRETSAIFRRVLDELEPSIRPGANEIEIQAAAHRLMHQYGVMTVQVGVMTAPFTDRLLSRAQGTVELSRESPVMVWLEGWGPSGYGLEVRQCYSFGPPADDLRRFYETQVEAVGAGVSALKPEARAADFVPEFARVVKGEGYGAEMDFNRKMIMYYLHGIGTDVVEAMWVPGKDRILKENEVVNVHPTVEFPTAEETRRLLWIGIADTFHITKDGAVPLTFDESSLVIIE